MLKTIALAAAVTFAALPASAQSYDPDVGSGNLAQHSESYRNGSGVYLSAPIRHSRVSQERSLRELYNTVNPVRAEAPAGGGRASAIRDCAATSRGYSEPTWGDMQDNLYRSCMAEHGQAE
jgi:hypothetical protein